MLNMGLTERFICAVSDPDQDKVCKYSWERQLGFDV
jgi:hypothetical protein